jgi:hypothetical protein
MAIVQKTLAHTPFRGCSQSASFLAVDECFPDRSTKGFEVARIVEQKTATTMLDLFLDAADAARDHRQTLPHRLGHAETEAFFETRRGESTLGVAVRGLIEEGCLPPLP